MNIASLITGLPRPLRRHKVVQLCLAVAPNSKIQQIHYNNGSTAMVDLSEPAARQCMLSGYFEPEFFDIVSPFLQKGGAFFDVGANLGLCSYGLMRKGEAPGVAFHLFEANRSLCNVLKQGVKLHPDRDITVNHNAVGESDGVIRFAIDPNDAAQSFVTSEGGEEVPMVALDNYVEKNAIPRVAFMKMDIEGWEPFALRGLERSFKAGKVEALYMEVAPRHLTRTGFATDQVFEQLRSYGMELFYCKPDDFKDGVVPASEVFELNVWGKKIKLAHLRNFPPNLQTDVLALHPQASFYQK